MSICGFKIPIQQAGYSESDGSAPGPAAEIHRCVSAGADGYDGTHLQVFTCIR